MKAESPSAAGDAKGEACSFLEGHDSLRQADVGLGVPTCSTAPRLPAPVRAEEAPQAPSRSAQPTAPVRGEEALRPPQAARRAVSNRRPGNVPAPAYAELHCLSNFSFQRGASSARELFERARELGYAALAITDECSMAGIVRALEASEATGLKLIVGTEVRVSEGPKLVLLAATRAGYTDLCRLITRARRRAAKGGYRVEMADLEDLGEGVLALWVPGKDGTCPVEAHACATADGPGCAAPVGAKAPPTGKHGLGFRDPGRDGSGPVGAHLCATADGPGCKAPVGAEAPPTGKHSPGFRDPGRDGSGPVGAHLCATADGPGCNAPVGAEAPPTGKHGLGFRDPGRDGSGPVGAHLCASADGPGCAAPVGAKAPPTGKHGLGFRDPGRVGSGPVGAHLCASADGPGCKAPVGAEAPPTGKHGLGFRDPGRVGSGPVGAHACATADGPGRKAPVGAEAPPTGKHSPGFRDPGRDGSGPVGAHLCATADGPGCKAPVGAEAPPTGKHGLGFRLLKRLFPGRLWIAVELHREADDADRLAALAALSEATGIPLVAAGDVHMHLRRRRALQDVLTAIRLKTTVAAAGLALFPNGERHLRRREDLARLYPPALLAETLSIAERCRFSLRELSYQYPHEVVPEGLTPAAHLARLTWEGAARRWPAGTPEAVAAQIRHELDLIAELGYEHYFLTVHDIVAWARGRGILCQGRGSAANSAVCFCLGITEVDPARMNLLFERFISRERNEPPDIDVDFEHERREEVIQYIYGKYGRERAALAATVICYRPRSAARDVGKALGLSLDQVDQIAKSLAWWNGSDVLEGRLAERGFDPASPVLRRFLHLVRELIDFPRHLSQHVGGFVIAEQALSTLVPVENAAMPERTLIQWDKDDLDTLGLLKIDCLALGMLTCIRKCLDLLESQDPELCAPVGGASAPTGALHPGPSAVAHECAPTGPDPSLPGSRNPGLCFPVGGASAPTGALHPGPSAVAHECAPTGPDRSFPGARALTLASIPPEDPATYAMLQRGDTVGVFQVESRAQMAMLPRLKPKNFFDLVIEVAIVRPGPIQGKMVHPYLRRRSGEEPVDYPSEDLRRVFERTLGVPIFQEQVMQLAIVAAGFSPGEADQLRRSMAAWKRRGGMDHFQQRIVSGMTARGYDEGFALQVFEQIRGFGSYGFPESHAASFALLVYASAWLKCHHPAAFACALLNSQPLGFYSRDQILQDIRAHGVRVLPVDVRVSCWDSGLESPDPGVGTWIPGKERSGPVGAHACATADGPGCNTPVGAKAPPTGKQDRSGPVGAHACASADGPGCAAPVGAKAPPTGKHGLGFRDPGRDGAGPVGAHACATADGPGCKAPVGAEAPFTGAQSPGSRLSLRLGLREIRGMRQASAERIVAARAERAFRDVQDLAERAGLDRHDLACLAEAGALRGLSGHRHRARWDADAVEQPLPLFQGLAVAEERAVLRPPSAWENAVADYDRIGHTLEAHPLKLLRPKLAARRWRRVAEVLALAHGTPARAAGLVRLRQRPGTASGVTFLTLEDESGWLNVVVWRTLAERQRRELLESHLLGIAGVFERAEGVCHLIAGRLHKLDALLDGLEARSRDFH
jgi:DNA polymerase III alpha subunit